MKTIDLICLGNLLRRSAGMTSAYRTITGLKDSVLDAIGTGRAIPPVEIETIHEIRELAIEQHKNLRTTIVRKVNRN